MFKLLSSGIARRLRREARKCYPSWDAAVAACGKYDSPDLTAFRLARARHYVPTPDIARRTLLPLVIKNLGLQEGSITDFGGSCGELGRSLQTIFPKVSYTVVEVPGIVAGVTFAAPVQFSETIPAACDIFYTGGTLQALEDPDAILAKAFSTAKRAVIFSRNSFSRLSLFRVARTRLFENGTGPLPEGFADHPVTYPHRTVNEADVHNAAAAHGFVCTAALDECDGVYPYGIAVYGRNLLFEPRDAAAETQ